MSVCMGGRKRRVHVREIVEHEEYTPCKSE